MDNKLSELSKPVAWTDERGNLCTNRNKERGLESRYHQDYEKYTTPFYSQEYVSALLAELEAKTDFSDKAIERISGLEKACDKYLRQTKKAERELLSAKERIAELERSNTSQDDHINQQQDRIESLEKKNGDLGRALGSAENRLATPVRLPDIEFVKISGIDFPVMRADVVKKEIRRAGFKVEGDE